MKFLTYMFLLLFSLTTLGQSNVEIKVNKYDETINAGSHFSVFFDVSGFQKNMSTSIILHPSWQILTTKTFKIDSSNYRFLYSIATPRDATSGFYFLKFNIISDSLIVRARFFEIEINQKRDLEILVLKQPEYVLEGNVFETNYLVQNNGNETERVLLGTSMGEVVGYKDSVDIPANKDLVVTVKQTVPLSDKNYWKINTDLKVFLNAEKVPIYKVSPVDVYSSSTKKSDLFLRLPVEVGMSFLNFNFGDKKIIAYQYIASGKGFLDFSKKHFIDFSVRGPNEILFPAIGSYDHYSLAYTLKKKTTITVGDYSNRVSNLLEFGRFGRGIKFEHAFDKVDFSVFFQKARFFPDQKYAFGGGVGYSINQNLKFKLNFINKGLYLDSTQFSTNIVEFSTMFKKRNFDIESDISFSHAKSKFDLGLYNKVLYTLNKITFNSELIFAGKDYYGFYNNSRMMNNGLNYNLNKKTNVGFNSNITRIRPSLDLNEFSVSPFSHSIMSFLSFQANSKNLFILNYTIQEREDRQTVSTFHFKESFVNLSYTLNREKLVVFTQGRYGNAQNLLSSDNALPRKSYSYITQPTFRVFKGMWLGGYFEQQHTNKYSLENISQDLTFYGATVRYSYGRLLNLYIMYRNNYAPDEFFEKRSFIDGSIGFDFRRHKLTANMGKAFVPIQVSTSQNTLFFSINYVLKLNVPVKKNKQIGHIKGHIVGNSENINLGGHVVQLGQHKTITDSKGAFSFNNLLPDTYYLSLPSHESLAGISTSIKLPLEVKIKSDSISMVQIPVVKTGGVKGKVILAFSERFKELNNGRVMPKVLLKLSNEIENYYTQVNEDFDFSFKEIKPGLWTLSTVLPGNQDQFEVEIKEKNINIEAEKIIEESFTIKSVERKVLNSGKTFNLIPNK